MTIPIHNTMAMPASIGTAHAIQASVPDRQMMVMNAPLSTEYPTRAPSAFQPGWPMEIVVGNGDPKSAAKMLPMPLIIKDGRVSYGSPAASADSMFRSEEHTSELQSR